MSVKSETQALEIVSPCALILIHDRRRLGHSDQAHLAQFCLLFNGTHDQCTAVDTSDGLHRVEAEHADIGEAADRFAVIARAE
jgi:hypothetical protein